MSYNILIAPDSFKESMTAQAVTQIIGDALEDALPKASVYKLPLSDGGEGFLDCMIAASGGISHELEVRGPLGETVMASYGYSADGKTAYVEFAQACGLNLVSEEDRDIWETSSYGVGQLIKAASENESCESIVVGLGGSASNDGGMGLLEALGFKFLDEAGAVLSASARNMELVHHIEPPKSGLQSLRSKRIVVAADVKNPLLGSQGAVQTFSRQKGATDRDLSSLEQGLASFAGVIESHCQRAVRDKEGVGAAGGAAFALVAILHGRIRPGFDVLSGASKLESLLTGKEINLIITGEGCYDRQTAQGKLIYSLCALAESKNIPVIALVGTAKAGSSDIPGLTAVFSIATGPISLEKAMRRGPLLLDVSARELASFLQQFPIKV